MKRIENYIIEKFKISSDIKNIKEDIFKELSNVINNFCSNELNISTNVYIYRFEDDKGNDINTKNIDNINKLARIYFWTKVERVTNNLDRISKKFEAEIDKIKKIKKTEVFATSICFYFENEEY